MKKNKSFFEVTESVARDIPYGYELVIKIELHSGSVVLLGPDGEELDYPSNMESMQDEVLDALEFAIEHHKNSTSGVELSWEIYDHLGTCRSVETAASEREAISKYAVKHDISSKDISHWRVVISNTLQ